MIEIQKILIPTDFSAYSQHALKYAVALAQSFKAKLYVMHVWEDAIVAAPAETFPTEILAEAERSAKEKLSQLTQELRTKGIDAEPVFASGTAPAEIVKMAREQEVDLITLATPRTHGDQSFRLWINGGKNNSAGTPRQAEIERTPKSDKPKPPPQEVIENREEWLTTYRQNN